MGGSNRATTNTAGNRAITISASVKTRSTEELRIEAQEKRFGTIEHLTDGSHHPDSWIRAPQRVHGRPFGARPQPDRFTVAVRQLRLTDGLIGLAATLLKLIIGKDRGRHRIFRPTPGRAIGSDGEFNRIFATVGVYLWEASKRLPLRPSSPGAAR